MLQVQQHDLKCLFYLCSLLNILTDLSKRRNACVLVAPILVVWDYICDDLTDIRKHQFISETPNQSTYALLAKSHVILLTFYGLLRPHPLLINLFIDVDHNLDYCLNNIFEQFMVFTYYWLLAFDDGDEEFEGLLAEGKVRVVIFGDDGFEF